MATAIIPETAKKVITPETLRSAAKHSVGCLVVPVRLRRAIKKCIREQEDPHTRNKVLRLSQSLNEIKGASLKIAAAAAASKDLVDEPQSRRWKIQSSYGDIGLKYRDDQTIAYVASRMPAVFSACYRVLSEFGAFGLRFYHPGPQKTAWLLSFNCVGFWCWHRFSALGTTRSLARVLGESQFNRAITVNAACRPEPYTRFEELAPYL